MKNGLVIAGVINLLLWNRHIVAGLFNGIINLQGNLAPGAKTHVKVYPHIDG